MGFGGGNTKFSNKMVLNINNLQRIGWGYKCSVLFAVFGIKYVLNITKKKGTELDGGKNAMFSTCAELIRPKSAKKY